MKWKKLLFLSALICLLFPAAASAKKYGFLEGTHKSKLELPNGTTTQLAAIQDPQVGMFFEVTDGADETDCTTGGGSHKNTCKYSGSAWVSTNQSSACSAIGSTTSPDLDIAGKITSCFTDTVDTGETTYTFSNPPSGVITDFLLFITDGGSQTVNFPASVDWEDGTAPDLTASGLDILYFLTYDGGSTWYGFTGGIDIQ